MTARRTHKWSKDSPPNRTLLPHESESGCEETHRPCTQGCGLVKITVHMPRGIPYRVWQHHNGKRWQGEHAPPCLVVAEQVTA